MMQRTRDVSGKVGQVLFLAAAVPSGGIPPGEESLLREIVDRHDGSLDVSFEDIFLSTFESAKNAIECALIIQQEPTLSNLRLGIHSHDTIDDQARNIAQRITALANEGQVLLTQAPFNLGREQISMGPDGSTLDWLAHGAFLFSGFETPIDIFEVCISGSSEAEGFQELDAGHPTATILDEPTLGWRPAVGLPVPGKPKWRLGRKLGAGGFGEIWLATEEQTGEGRAFKFCFNADRLRALKREITLFRLMTETLGDRDDISRLYDVRLEEPPFYLELEYAKGGDLVSWSENEGGMGSIPLGTRLELVAQIADSLSAAHSIGIIHKDVKPSNVLIEERGDGSIQTKLTDFGIGELVERERLRDSGIVGSGFTTHASTLQTQYSQHSGTHLYFAPELHAGKEPSIQTDVFALGVLCYQVVAGDLEMPLGHGWQRRIEDPLLVEDIAACVDVDPEKRLGSAEELAKRLRGLEKRHNQRESDRRAKEEAERAKALAERYRKRRKVVFLSSVVGLAVIVFTSWMAIQMAILARNERNARIEAEREFYCSQINSSYQLVKGGQVQRVRRILATFPPEYRHWEWGYLQYLCKYSPSRILEGHTGWVGQICFSPDGKWLASAAGEDSVRLWDVEKAELIKVVDEEGDNYWGVSFSSDGKYLAFSRDPPGDATAAWQIGICDLASERKTFIEDAHTDAVYSVEFSPDGRHLLTGSFDTYAKLWDVETHTLVRTFGPHPDQVWSAAFSRDGRRIVTGCAHYPPQETPMARAARIWDVETGNLVCKLEGHSAEVSGVAFSPDGRFLATGSWDGTAKLWDTEKWREVWTSPRQERPVVEVSFSPDSKLFATAGRDGKARIFDVNTHSEVCSPLEGHNAPLDCVTFSPDGKLVATSSEDRTIRLWNLESPKDVLADHEDAVNSVAFSSDSHLILTGSRDKTAKLWNSDTGLLIHTFEHNDRVYGVAISPDGALVATTCGDGTATIWNATTGEKLLSFQKHTKAVHDIVFSPDGKCVATASLDRTVRIWDPRTGRELLPSPLKHSGGVTSVAFSPDGNLLVTASFNDSATVWDTETGKRISLLLNQTRPVSYVTFSSDSKRIATVANNTVQIWNAKTGLFENELKEGHTNRVYEVVFSPDDKRVVTVSADKTAVVWDTQTARQLLVLSGHEDKIFSVAFRPDGKVLATASEDGTARLWRALRWR